MDINKFIVSDNMSIIEAMESINTNGKGLAFVCSDGILKGVITDGDIRRHILKRGSLDSSVKDVANYNPKYILINENIDLYSFMEKSSIAAVPIVNSGKKLMSIQFYNSEKVYKDTNLTTKVVIMAGGKGTRLYPYTKILPKPLIPIGEKTITEHILDKFKQFGCRDFSIIVNYKKNIMKAFFNDSEMDYKINFIDEEDFMGTGGGLKLLEGKISSTFFMTNCDILVDADYSDILHYHESHKNIITIVSAVKNVTIPYGSIKIDDNGNVLELQEKPTFNFIANTGFYVIEPKFLNYIPDNEFIHITDIIDKCIESNENVGVYPISEKAWMDMGQLDELENMRRNIGENI